MLYDLNLDDRSYREIEEEAVFHIQGKCPEWTNYNPSDPGITLVQLFSWLSEVQQYHLSQPNEWKRRKYLKLLGTEIRHIRPALGAVNVGPAAAGDRQFPLLKGTRFSAGDMPFETVEKEWVDQVQLIGVYTMHRESLSGYHPIEHAFEKQMKFYPFGTVPEPGDQCYFVLDGAFGPGKKLDLYFDICTQYEVTRNPADEGFLPLASLQWEYYCQDGWEKLEVESDGTYGLIQSGNVRFHIQKEMEKEPCFAACQLRVTLVENDYDLPPLIQNIYLNEIQVLQQYSACDYESCEVELSGQETEFSLCSGLYLAKQGAAELYLERGEGWTPLKEARREKTEDGEIRFWFHRPAWAKGHLQCRLALFEKEFGQKRIIGTGDSFAGQEYDLHIPGILYESFEIMVYDQEAGGYVPYEKVEDFDICTPKDRAYILDVPGQCVMFGDCERGLAPDGEIRIIRLKLSRGKSGNIKAGKIRACEAFPEMPVMQYKRVSGGEDEEDLEQCFERFRNELAGTNRGVTYSDYEKLAKSTPGLFIVDSRVIPPTEWKGLGGSLPENQISIVVQPLGPEGKHAGLSETYKKNISRVLEKRKMLGTRIQILSPEYIGISVYSEIVIKPQFPDAKRQMETAVRTYLDEKTWKIGKPVLSSTLYGILDTLPCVWQVRSLSVNARGNRCRHLVNGDIGLPPNGLAYLENMDFCIYTAD